MKVVIFDESHEKDLEKEINSFLDTHPGMVADIKYQVAICCTPEGEQLYSFSAMLLYVEEGMGMIVHDNKGFKRAS